MKVNMYISTHTNTREHENIFVYIRTSTMFIVCAYTFIIIWINILYACTHTRII